MNLLCNSFVSRIPSRRGWLAGSKLFYIDFCMGDDDDDDDGGVSRRVRERDSVAVAYETTTTTPPFALFTFAFRPTHRSHRIRKRPSWREKARALS